MPDDDEQNESLPFLFLHGFYVYCCTCVDRRTVLPDLLTFFFFVLVMEKTDCCCELFHSYFNFFSYIFFALHSFFCMGRFFVGICVFAYF